MEIFKKIIECSDEEVDTIIEEAIRESNEKANKVDKLGFLNNGKTNSTFKGFIL